jgi:predicted GTPase
MGDRQRQIQELAATIDAADGDVVVAGTPISLGRLLGTGRPLHQAGYAPAGLGHRNLADVLAPILARAKTGRPVAAAR